MMAEDFESKVETVLRLTGGTCGNQAKADAESFKYLQSVPSLKAFVQWFVDEIHEDNCLSAVELRDFKELQKKGAVLSRKGCQEALSHFYESSPDILDSFNNTYLEVVEDEIQETSSRIEILKALQEKLINDNKEIDSDLESLDSTLEAADKSCIEMAIDYSTSSKAFCEKLDDLRKSFSLSDNSLSRLKDQLLLEKSKHRSNDPDKSLPSNSSFENEPQKQYLMLMNFSKFEELNASFIDTLNAVIRSKFDKYQQVLVEASGDLDKSAKTIVHFNGITFDFNLELRRLNEGISSTKLGSMLAEIELVTKNKTFASLKQLQLNLATKQWQPDLIKMRADIVILEGKLKDCEICVTEYKKILSEQCQKWSSDSLVKKSVEDLLSDKIAKKANLVAEVDVLLSTVITQMAYNLFLMTLLQREELKIRTLAFFISDFYSTIEQKIEILIRDNILLESNFNDYTELKSHADLENSGISLKMAHMLNVDTANLSAAVQGLVSDISVKEDLWIQQCTNKVKSLSKMKQHLDAQKCQLLSYLATVKHKIEFFKVEERISEMAFELRCTKMDILNFKGNINKNPYSRDKQLQWVNFLTRKPELLVKNED